MHTEMKCSDTREFKKSMSLRLWYIMFITVISDQVGVDKRQAADEHLLIK